LSEALSALVDRGDLDIPLKLVLGNFHGMQEPSHGEIVSALNLLHISRDRYDEVLQKWLGDLSWTLRLLRPLLLIMHPEVEISILTEITNEDQLQESLRNFDYSPLNLKDVLELTRNSQSMESLGLKMYDLIGDRAQLDLWNQVLMNLGEIQIRNEQAIDEFETYLDITRKPLRSIIRDLLCSKSNNDSFSDFDEKLMEIECPDNFSTNYWSVPFDAVMNQISRLLGNWLIRREILDVLTSATDNKDLVNKLENLGLEPNIDPLEIHAENQSRLLFILGEVRKAIIAWCLKNKLGLGTWDQDITAIKTQFSNYLNKEAFLSSWDDIQCFRIIGQLDRLEIHKEFWNIYDSAGSLGELFVKMGINSGDLEEVEERLEKHKRDQEKKKNTIIICGQKFVNTQDNLPNLWDHIIHGINDDNLPDVNLDNFEDLKDMPSHMKRKRKPKKGARGGKSGGRISQAMKDLMGLAGEIHAYRALRKKFGSDFIGPGCWKSENSLYRFPENTTNDGFGCDFLIHDGNAKYFIEVKATQEEDESIQLGASEVELAIEKAGKRKEIFQIFHVINALTQQPLVRILPNPYDKKYKNKFRFVDAGLRIRYEID
jgi:hypothetical protein